MSTAHSAASSSSSRYTLPVRVKRCCRVVGALVGAAEADGHQAVALVAGQLRASNLGQSDRLPLIIPVERGQAGAHYHHNSHQLQHKY